MSSEKPTAREIEHIATDLGLGFEPDEVELHRNLVEAALALAAPLADLEEPSAPPPQRAFERPTDAENPFGAWYLRTHIEGAAAGPLAGRSVALKDNVMLAGVPMMNGTRILEGYVPPVDATIVTRILEAGATIAGKAVCEAYCLSGGSHTSATGPVRNPRDPARTAGGSSSGSAALVAAGAVDMAIGGDQGGSIRVPSAYCGIVGLKPTHGLVPYTGILGFDPSIDHAGPMTRTVRDNALLLQVIAGADGIDSRQRSPRTEPYVEALERGVEGLRVGVLREGFGQPGAEADVDEKVRAAARRLEKLGMNVAELSLPMHRSGPVIGFVTLQASLDFVFHLDGLAVGTQDPPVLSYLRRQHQWRERAALLPDNVKFFLVLAEYVKRKHGYEHVARGLLAVRQLRAAYDQALRAHDLLLLPTASNRAPFLPEPDAPRAAVIAAAISGGANTMPFNHTHHPALSVPCGCSEGLPVGMMLVGRPFEESTLYRVAHAFEQHEDWRSL